LTIVEVVFVLYVFLFSSFILGIIFYYYGKRKGEEEAYTRPEMCYPSVRDVTVLGKYRISKQSPDQIVENLTEWLLAKGFRAMVFPNVVEVFRVAEPPEARKKKNIFDKLRLLRAGYPDRLVLFLYPSAKGEEVLEAEVKCLPVMFRKLGQGVQYAFPKSDVGDAQRLCKDFMESTMRILNAEVLVKPYVESTVYPVRHFEFLYNTPMQSNVNNKAHELIANSMRQVLLTGWVDREFIGDLENAQTRGVKVRVITKSTEGSEKTVRTDFKRLLTKINKDNIKLNSNFHDRFLVCDGQCIIGSMYYTGSSKTKYESVIYTDDEDICAGLVTHFERIWSDKNSKTPR